MKRVVLSAASSCCRGLEAAAGSGSSKQRQQQAAHCTHGLMIPTGSVLAACQTPQNTITTGTWYMAMQTGQPK